MATGVTGAVAAEVGGVAGGAMGGAAAGHPRTSSRAEARSGTLQHDKRAALPLLLMHKAFGSCQLAGSPDKSLRAHIAGGACASVNSGVCLFNVSALVWGFHSFHMLCNRQA